MYFADFFFYVIIQIIIIFFANKQIATMKSDKWFAVYYILFKKKLFSFAV